jgi:hypothetical protein
MYLTRGSMPCDNQYSVEQSAKQQDKRRLPGNWHGPGKLVPVSVQPDAAAQGFSSALDDTETVTESRPQPFAHDRLDYH